MNDGALTQLAIDLSVIKDALARFPAEAFMSAHPGAPHPVQTLRQRCLATLHTPRHTQMCSS